MNIPEESHNIFSEFPDKDEPVLKPIRVFKTTDIIDIIAGIPGPEHRHFRAAMETQDEILVFQEATIAALVRAYIAIKTHPTRRAIHLRGAAPENRKKEYAAWQLMETDADSQEAEEMLQHVLEEK